MKHFFRFNLLNKKMDGTKKIDVCKMTGTEIIMDKISTYIWFADDWTNKSIKHVRTAHVCSAVLHQDFVYPLQQEHQVDGEILPGRQIPCFLDWPSKPPLAPLSVLLSKPENSIFNASVMTSIMGACTPTVQQVFTLLHGLQTP
jgi:hypothetical protein